MDEATIRRFWPKVDRSAGPDGCWPWQGTMAKKSGYGVFSIKGQNHPAHRVSYLIAGNEIPDGLQLDHLCRNRACVNPAHLEPVTIRENLLRGETIAARMASKTHCEQGHEFTPESTGIRKATGYRYCKKCRSNYKRSRNGITTACDTCGKQISVLNLTRHRNGHKEGKA